MNEEKETTESEVWQEYKGLNKRKRWENYRKSLQILTARAIEFRVLDATVAHVRVAGEWNFWPTTGNYAHLRSGIKGRGVFNLLKALKSHD